MAFKKLYRYDIVLNILATCLSNPIKFQFDLLLSAVWVTIKWGPVYGLENNRQCFNDK